MLDFINKPLEFFWRKSSQFINATLKVLDKIGIKVDVGLNEDMLKDFNAKAGELTSNYVFDEEETRAEGEKVLKEQQEALTKLKNDRAGYQLAINDIDKTAADNAAKTAEEKLEIEKSRLEKLNDLYASYLETNEEASAVTEQEKLDLQKQRDLKEINELAKTENEKSNLTALLNEKYFNLQLELDKKLAEEKDKINKQKISDQDAEWLRLQEFTMQKNEYEKLVLTQKYEAEYLAAEGNAALQTELKKKLEKDLGDIDDKAKQEAKEKEQALLSAKLAFAQQGLSLVAEIAGKGSKIGKAVAVAQATISGIEGVQNAYSTAQKSPITVGFPAYPVVQASLAGVFAALQIRKILSTNVGGASSGSSVSGGGGGGSAPAPPQFNIVGQSSTNQLSQTIAGQQNRPIQTYVVGNQVSTQQSLDRNAVATSTFG
jgi:hypothetical protein